MKFWKPILFTSVFLLGVSGTIFYSACEQDKCTNITCNNGGSCNAGLCVCPSGYEDPTCNTKVITRFLGTYAGFSSCNNGAEIIDTVFVYADNPKKNTTIKVVQKTHPTDILYGYVTSNESTYQMFLNSITYTNYSKSFHITLQSDNSLVLNSYEADYTNPVDTIRNSCAFVGTKH